LGRCEGERRNETIMEVGNKMSTNRSSPCPLTLHLIPYTFYQLSSTLYPGPHTFHFEPFAVRLVPVCSSRTSQPLPITQHHNIPRRNYAFAQNDWPVPLGHIDHGGATAAGQGAGIQDKVQPVGYLRLEITNPVAPGAA